jgi:hypothetical protein
MSPRIQQLFTQRRILGGIASLFFLLALGAVADGLQHMARQDASQLVIIAGESVPISGWVPANATSQARIHIQPPLSFTLRGQQTGYYLGGNQWLGTITAPETTPEGNFTASVLFPGAPAQEFHIRVVSSAAHAQRLAPSVLIRTLGVHPYLIAAILATCGGGTAIAIYRLSSTLEKLLALQNLAETTIDHRGRLTVPWGSRHGLTPETRLAVVLPSGEAVGYAQVVNVWEDHARASCPGVRGVVLVARPLPQ